LARYGYRGVGPPHPALCLTAADPPCMSGGCGVVQVVADGYGIGYGMDANNLRFVVTSYLQVNPFLGALDEALKDMRTALEQGKAPAADGDAPRKKR
jgi:hypothetical protein